MQPDNMTPSRQGSGHKRSSKNERTRSDDQIPGENLATSGIREGATQDSDVGGTAPAVRHPNRPERDKMGGNFNGPGKAARK